MFTRLALFARAVERFLHHLAGFVYLPSACCFDTWEDRVGGVGPS